MKRVFFLISIFFYFFYVPKTQAFPDKETIQLNLMIAKAYTQGGLQTYEEFQEKKRELTNELNGAKGMLQSAKKMSEAIQSGDLDGAISAAEDVGLGAEDIGITGENIEKFTNIKNMTPSFISNVNDIKNTEEEVSKNYTPQYGEEKDIEITEEQDTKIDAIQRDNVARMYAKALVNRVKTAKEKAANVEEIDTSDTRQIISAIKEQAMISASRLKRIAELESAIYEFKTIEKNKKYQTQNNQGTSPSQAEGEKQ